MKRLALGALLALLSACGGGEEDPSDGGSVTPDGGGAVDDASLLPSADAAISNLMDPGQRATAASAALSEMQRLKSQGLSREDAAARLVTFMLADPAFASAGYLPEFDNVWANFRDGVPFIIFDNQKPNPEVVPEPTFKRPLADTVPKDRQYRIIRSLGSPYSANEGATKTLLDKHGYRPAARMSDLVEHLMTDVSGDGFFMWATHGGGYKWASDGVTLLYGFSTLSNATAENELLEPYRSLLANGEIGIGFAGVRYATAEELASADATGTIDRYTGVDLEHRILNRRVYFLNPKFVQTRFKFTGNSVVIMNACTSLTPEMVNAFEKAGAAAYLGWTAPTYKGGPTSFIAIDRMIGGSSAAPIPDPKERPFDIGPVFDWMKANGLDRYQDGRTTVTFSYKLLRQPYGILAPSIQSIQVVESPFGDMKATVHVSGIFGTKDESLYPRELLCSGVSQTITGGGRDVIEAELDSRGPGSFGDCVVKVGGRDSNVVPITAWNIPVKVEATTSGSGKFTVMMTLLVRQDVHRFRTKPGGDADGTEADPAPQVALLMADSKATWTASGSYSNGCTHALSGSGSATLPTSGVLSERFLMGLGTFDRQAFQIQVTALLLAGQFAKDNITCPEPAMAMLPIAVPPAMTFKLKRETFEIQPGEATFSAPPFTIKATWETVLPFSPPTSMTPS